MVDRQLVTIAGSVAGALAVSVTLLGGIYRVFLNPLEATGAIIISAMVLILFALLVLSIDNRIRINQMKGGDNE